MAKQSLTPRVGWQSRALPHVMHRKAELYPTGPYIGTRAMQSLARNSRMLASSGFLWAGVDDFSYNRRSFSAGSSALFGSRRSPACLVKDDRLPCC